MNTGDVVEELLPVFGRIAPQMDLPELSALTKDFSEEIFWICRRNEGQDNRAGKLKGRLQVDKVNRLARQLGEALALDRLGSEASKSLNRQLREQPQDKSISITSIFHIVADNQCVRQADPSLKLDESKYPIVYTPSVAYDAPTIEHIQKLMVALCKAASSSYGDLEKLPIEPPTPHRPRKGHVLAISKRCGVYFERLSGKPPTRIVIEGHDVSPFVEFLSEVFAACRIKASPGHNAKLVIADMEKSR